MTLRHMHLRELETPDVKWEVEQHGYLVSILLCVQTYRKGALVYTRWSMWHGQLATPGRFWTVKWYFLLSLSGCSCSSNPVAEPPVPEVLCFACWHSACLFLPWVSDAIFKDRQSQLPLPFLLRTCSTGIWLFLWFGVGMYIVSYRVWESWFPVLIPVQYLTSLVRWLST